MAHHLELDAILRSDLSLFVRKVFETVSPNDAFKPNWHIDAIAHELTRCHTGENRRLLITQPPRSLKSICASVAFPAWALGHDPTLRFLCVSYSESLATEFTRQFRMVTESEWYRRLFPGMRLKTETRTEDNHDQRRQPGRLIGRRLDHRPWCGLHRHRRPPQGRGRRLRNGTHQGSPTGTTARSAHGSTTRSGASSFW